MKIIYVSNHDPSRLKKHLEEVVGSEFDSANNRQEAMSALQSDNYRGVIMTDLKLAPGVLEEGEVWHDKPSEGYENGLKVARFAVERKLPVVVLSSYVAEYKEKLKEMGVEHTYIKVIDYIEFLDKIQELFKS